MAVGRNLKRGAHSSRWNRPLQTPLRRLCKATLAIFKFKLIQSALSGNSKVRPGPAAPDSVGNLNLPVAL